MTNTALGSLLESFLLMAPEPLSVDSLAEATGAAPSEVLAELQALARFYVDSERGFRLREVGQGWRYYTLVDNAPAIAAWAVEGQPAKLSQAALETLSVIAYLQPISRSRVAAVRGVNVDGVVRTLIARGMIAEQGSDESSGATLFVTTDLFLEKLGLTSLDALPELAPHLPEAQALEEELTELAQDRQLATATADATPQAALKDETHD